jgi:hypothetical protein
MLSLEKCRQYLPDEPDERIVAIRDLLYSFAEDALDKHLFSGSVPVTTDENVKRKE